MHFINTEAKAKTTLIAILVLLSPLASVNCHAQDSAVALMYSRVGATDGATTNTEEFENHLSHLAANNYQVLPLPQIVAALQIGAAVPENAVAMTFDGGHISIYREVWPRLKVLGFSFTVFIATDVIDSGGDNVMSWDHVRELSSSGVTIGTLGGGYKHLVALDEDEATADITRANQRLMEEIGTAPELFAYPFGEYDADLQRTIARHGYSAAFGQHSSVIYGNADYMALPRFPLVGSYANMPRFRTVVDTLPLPVADVVPNDPVVTYNPPSLGFTVVGEVGPLENLACYLAPFGKLNIEQLGPARIEVRFPDALPTGRNRVNCTLPGPGGRWRWFGLQLLVP
ncbi:MAG TPA: chitin deacetylase [Alphaproteobacteria bacterium]|nr:chitin deacetylase [Alphaproteobacteria bacterium]